jgi:enhancing lycopene biosynthesis protein 2
MAKRVGLVLSGCGARDGSEIREAVLAWLSIERRGGEVVCAAPTAVQDRIVDHLTGEADGPPRAVLSEAARLARGQVRDLASLGVDDVDALVFPGGAGVGSVLSNYAQKGVVCDVHPDVVRLLKGCLGSHRPMGFVCLAPILAARVLGPVAGVRLTLGSRANAPAKHAAVMGADVRPCAPDDLILDKKARVVSTPAYMYEDARLPVVAEAIDKLVRLVMSMARDRHPTPGASPET